MANPKMAMTLLSAATLFLPVSVAQNVAAGSNSYIASGQQNTAYGAFGAILGGKDNTAGENVASDKYQFIGGGFRNVAAGFGAVVGGGRENTAFGAYVQVISMLEKWPRFCLLL